MRLLRERRRGGVIEATVLTLVCLAILLGLGKWQLDRRVWKESLIATLNERLAEAPRDLPPRADWGMFNETASEFRRVTAPVEFIPGEEALVYTAGSPLRPDVRGPGYWVFAPARLPGGSVLLVNRGFVPLDRKEPSSRPAAPSGVVDIAGYLRWPEKRGSFTPNDEPANNVWYLRDTAAMAAAKNWQVSAPFYIDLEGPAVEGGPVPGRLQVKLPNSHLQYAITWFGLALGLAGVYVTWLAGRLRRRF